MSIGDQSSDSVNKIFDAFISHSSIDKTIAVRLAHEIEEQGFRVWLDKREVLVGHNIVERVNWGIAESRFLILLLSANSVQSHWVKEEWTAAYISEIESKQVIILPALLEDCAIPPLLQSKRSADLRDWQSGAQDIIDAIRGHSSASENRQPTIVRRSVVTSPVHFPVNPPFEPISEIFLGGVLFTGIPKVRFRHLSLSLHIGQRENAIVQIDDEDAHSIGATKFQDGHKWRWGPDADAIPCVMVCIDSMSGSRSEYMLPTSRQVNRQLHRNQQVIFVFLIEDSTETEIVGARLGCIGLRSLVVRSAYISFET